MEQSQLVTERGLSSDEPGRADSAPVGSTSGCGWFHPALAMIGAISKLDSPGFFYLCRVNVRRGSISGLQRPLSGRNSPGSGGSALGHTSITRNAAGIRN